MSFTKDAKRAADALAAKTVAVMRGIPNEALRKRFLRELLIKVGGHAEQNTGIGLNSGKSLQAALSQAYLKEGARAFERGREEALGRWEQDWGGLQGQNVPSGTSGGQNAPSGTSSSGIDWQAINNGIERATEAFNNASGLIDAVGDMYGSVTDVISGGDDEEEPEPEPAQRYTLDLSRIPTRRYHVHQVPPQHTGQAGGSLLASIPSWALAVGAAAAAGGAYYLIAGRKGKGKRK